MKKIVIILAVVITVTIIFVYSFLFIKSKLNYHYEEEPFDKYLSYYEQGIKYSLLKKLGYRTSRRMYKYRKDFYNIVVLDHYATKDDLDKWTNWLVKGRKLIVFFKSDADNETELDRYFAKYFNWYSNTTYCSNISIPINDKKIKKINNKILKDVSSLYINTNNYMMKEELYKLSKKIKPILRRGKKIFIANEKYNDADIIYISDYLMFSDKSILQMDNAIFLNNLLQDHFDEPIVFDNVRNHYSNKLSAKRATTFFLEGSFKFVSLQLLILALVFFLIFIKRFGRPIDTLQFRNRSLQSHLEAVGSFFEKTSNKKILSKILDEYFILQLEQTLKLFSGEKNIFEEINNKYDLSKEEKDLFIFDSDRTEKEIVEIQIKRHKFLKKIREG